MSVKKKNKQKKHKKKLPQVYLRWFFAYNRLSREKGKEKQTMSRVCGLFLFGVGIGLVIALIFPKTFFMVIMAALCLLAGYNLFCGC